MITHSLKNILITDRVLREAHECFIKAPMKYRPASKTKYEDVHGNPVSSFFLRKSVLSITGTGPDGCLLRFTFLNDEGMLDSIICPIDEVEDHLFAKHMEMAFPLQSKRPRDWNPSMDVHPLRFMQQCHRLPPRCENTAIIPEIMHRTLFAVLPDEYADLKPTFTGTIRHIDNDIARKHNITVGNFICASYAIHLINWLDKQGSYNPYYYDTAIRIKQNIEYADRPWLMKPNHYTTLAHDPSLPFEAPDYSVYDVITKVEKPMFERSAENRNAKTFDFIRIFINVQTKASYGDRRNAYIRRHREDFLKIALERIAASPVFRHKEVPIQFLKPTEMTITKDNRIEIIFELKIQD